MICTGTQTEKIYPQILPVDLDESLESSASTSSAVSECTPPDFDENNNLYHHDVLPSYCSRKYIVFEECLDQLLQFCTICGKNVTPGNMWLELCCLCLGYVYVGKHLHGNHNSLVDPCPLET